MRQECDIESLKVSGVYCRLIYIYCPKSPYTQGNLTKLINKFKKTGSVANQPRSELSPASTDEDTTIVVLVYIVPYIWRLVGHPELIISTVI